MADREKIVLLTRLALYDKYMSDSDKKTNGYFLHDYIYSKNIRTRFFAFFGALILILFNLIYRIFVEKTDIFMLDYKKELTDIVVFVVIVLVVYTAIGSLKAAVAYRASQKRIKAYLEVLKRTGEQTGAPRRAAVGRAYERRYGRDIVYTGADHKRG